MEHTDYLTLSSKHKLNQIYPYLLINRITDPKLSKLLDSMKTAFVAKSVIHMANPINLQTLQKEFIDFDQNFNEITNSKFQSDVLKMNRTLTLNLVIKHDVITINFLFTNFELDMPYVAVIMHALNTFCHLYPYHYGDLTINICLDNNERTMCHPQNLVSYDDIFNYFKKKSTGFNVSGVTYRAKKEIFLTKHEEIIKLMYHEMIHLVGLDDGLIHADQYYDWAITPSGLKIYEAYTEFVSLILNVGYEAIHLWATKSGDLDSIFSELLALEISYSGYLSAAVLQFYGYDETNYMDFFTGKSDYPKYCPVYIWEYVLLRANLFTNIHNILAVSDFDFRIKNKNKGDIIKQFEITEKFMNQLSYYMANTKPIDSISYLLLDLNWCIF